MKRFLGIIGLLLASFASAHGLATSQSQIVGEYKIDFEYNTIGSVSAGDFTSYTFHLLNSKDGSPTDFDSAFVRISRDQVPYLASSLYPSDILAGTVSLGGIISDSGNFIASVSFIKSGKEIAQSDFNFKVEQFSTVASTKTKIQPVLIASIIFFVVLLGFFIYKVKLNS